MNHQINYDEYDYETKVSIYSTGIMGDFSEDVAPLIDALDDHFMFVSITRTHFQPPAAGGGPVVEVALSFIREHADTIRAAGAGAIALYIVGVIQKMGEDSWDGVRKALARIVGRKKPDDGVRETALLTIQIDRPRFVFDKTIDEEEFNRRMAAIADFVQTLPEGALKPMPGPPDFDWYYWSEKRQSWARFTDEQEADREEWRREHPEAAAQMDEIWEKGWQGEWDENA